MKTIENIESLTPEIIVQTVHNKLYETFPAEEFLLEECLAVYQALVTSIGFQVLDILEEKSDRGEPLGPVYEHVTTDGLSTSASPEEVISSIEATSGLEEKHCIVAYQAVLDLINEALTTRETIKIDHIGELKAEGKGYRIHLSEDLRFEPLPPMYRNVEP